MLLKGTKGVLFKRVKEMLGIYLKTLSFCFMRFFNMFDYLNLNDFKVSGGFSLQKFAIKENLLEIFDLKACNSFVADKKQVVEHVVKSHKPKEFKS